MRSANDVEHVGGDGEEDPVDKALIDHTPLSVVALGGGGGNNDVGAGAEFADDAIEERAPLSIVRIGEIQNDGDVGLDVDGLKNRGRRSHDGNIIVEIAGRGGGRKTRGNRRGGFLIGEERIGVHAVHGGAAERRWAAGG